MVITKGHHHSSTHNNTKDTLSRAGTDMAILRRNLNISPTMPINSRNPATVPGKRLVRRHKARNSSAMVHHRGIRSSTVTVPESARR